MALISLRVCAGWTEPLLFAHTTLLKITCHGSIVFLMACDCKYSVSLPHGEVDWSAVCDCGIFWSYLLTFGQCSNVGLTVK